MTSKKTAAHKWQFPSRIRPNAFTWKSSPVAVARIKQSVAEIKSVSRNDPALAAEGAVRLIERLSPALEHVNSSSGSLGNAVNRAIEALVPIISAAEVPAQTREKWLERLYEAHEEDQVPYIESLADYWGDLCAGEELASTWADRMIDITRMALGPDGATRGHYHGSSACLSALLRAGRYEEIQALVAHTNYWHYKQYVAKALAAQGRHDEAIALAESLRGSWTPDTAVDRLCERILLDAGRSEEAYRRFGLVAHRMGTHLATFREIAKTYPGIPREQIIRDLIQQSRGEEGKWFTAAKELGMLGLAMELANESPCDPKTLTRAARAYAERDAIFAAGVGFAAVRWLAEGFGYEITSVDVWSAYQTTLKAAEAFGRAEATQAALRKIVAASPSGSFVRQVLGRELGLS